MAQSHHADLPEERSDEVDVERLVRWYYGPPLEEQPLSSASWEAVRARLETMQATAGQEHLVSDDPSEWFPLVVAEIQTRLKEQTCLPFPRMQYSLLKKSRIPEACLSFFRPGTLVLGLPREGVDAIPVAVWEVVLATGMARTRSSSRLLPPLLLFAGLFCLVLVSGLGVLGWGEHIEPQVLWAAILIGVVLGIGLLVLAHLAGYREVFLADQRACSWLGTARLCEGLEQLMQMSLTPHKARWGMPSLLTRGKRLCGIRLPYRLERDISEAERSPAKD